MPKQTAFLNKELNEAKMSINDSRNNKVTQRILTLSDGHDETNNYAMKNSKSMVSVESDDDDDDDKNDLGSHCSVQAVVSYSDSSISLTKENKEDDDDDDDTQRSESTDDEFNDLQKRTRSIHSKLIKSLSHSSGRVVGDEAPYIHSRNTGRQRGDDDFIGRKIDGNKGVENVVDDDDDDDDDDILQKWRRRRRLEKLKMEHNRKLQETTQFHELEKLNDVLTTDPDTPLHNLPPFPVKSSAQHHHQQQHSLHHEQVAQHQQQQHQYHNQHQPLGFHKTFSKENNQMLSKHPLKIHFCNVSRCCRCCRNFSHQLEQKKKELPLASERCHLGGGDGAPKPHDHDQPTRDTGVCRSLISQPAQGHLHQHHHHHRCKNSNNNIHAKALPSQSKNIIQPASTLDDKLPMMTSVDDTGDRGRALMSSSGHIAGGRSDKKVVEVQGGVANGIYNPDKETSRLDSRGFRDQSTITDDKESSLKNNELKKIYQRHRLPEIDVRKTVSMPSDNSKLLKDFDPLTCSFTTVSSLETNIDGGDGDDDVATTSHHTIRHSTFSNSKPQSENLGSDKRPDGVDNPTRLHRTPFKLEEVHGKHLDDDGDGGVFNKEKDGSKKDLNTCIDEVNSHSNSEFADIESLLEVSDGKEFSEDEILKGLRERRKRCLRRIKHLNKLLPP